MPARTALLLQTHFFDRGAARNFARLRAQAPRHFEACVLLHLPPRAPLPPRLRDVPHHVVRTPELRFPLYPAKCGAGDPNWNLWNGGHTDLIALHFLRAHPEYERAWVVEYDVRFTAPWHRFFDVFEDEPADLIVPVLRRRADQPEWSWWHTLKPAEVLPPENTLCSFMPIHRVTREAIRVVDAAWRAGWAGHSEAVWPSAIAQAGLTLLDPGGEGPFTPPELRGRFYTSTMHDIGLAPGTMFWKPPLYRPGSRPDMLWHPIKPFWPRVELRQAVRDLRVDLGALRRRWLPWDARTAARGG